MVYYDPRKPKPWPVRLLNKWGITDDTKATNITILGAILGIMLAVFLYMQVLAPDTDSSADVTPSMLQEMERMNVPNG